MGKRLIGPKRVAFGIMALLVLGGCASSPQVSRGPSINDPHERENRAVHEFNKAVDRNIVRPLTSGSGDGKALRPVRQGVTNLGDALETPSRIVNNVLQGRIEDAGHNSFRLAVNLTLGLGGLFDPASSLGLEPRDTDFGETLHVWGTGEGVYLEIPLLGPSTERDLVGDIVDIGLNPLGRILPTEALPPARVVGVGSKLAERSRLGSTLDDIFDNSADSYAQTRLIYLQNRRFELSRNDRRAGRTATNDAIADPYEDPFGEAAQPDPYDLGADEGYVDPYEDPFGP